MGMSDKPSSRFLVRHNAGMSDVLWWITAPSETAITDSFADVQVEHDPAVLQSVKSWGLAELTLAEAATGPLQGLWEQKRLQRLDPRFGKLKGVDRLYFRLVDPDEPDSGEEWLSEHDAQGWRLRQVERRTNGAAIRTSDWPMNPPWDLGDPNLVDAEITADEFETAWDAAVPDDGV